jgi:hypothetical protein
MKKLLLFAVTCMIGYYASAECARCDGGETKCCTGGTTGDTYYMTKKIVMEVE